MVNKFKKLLTLIMALAVTLVAYPAFAATTYDIDHTHSTLGFAVKHLQVGTTRGGFNDYSGTIKYDPEDLSTFAADVTIQVGSIDTKVEGRDNHLKSADFFDAEAFPTITFKSNRLEKRGEGTVLVGDLTMKDVTKTLTIPVTLAGPVAGMKGGQVMSLAAQIVVNRQDYNISWNKNLDNGGLVVGDEVDVIIELEAHAKPAE